MRKFATLLAPTLFMLLVAAIQGPSLPIATCSGCVAVTEAEIPSFDIVIFGDDDATCQVIRNLKINGQCAAPLPGSCIPVGGCFALITATMEHWGEVTQTITAGVNECGGYDFEQGTVNGGWSGDFWVSASCTNCTGEN